MLGLIKTVTARAKFSQQGFTLIELVIIIVIVGLLAVTAIPLYVNMIDKAAEAHAQAVFGAARAAAMINFSKGRLGLGGFVTVTNISTLSAVMDGGLPTGWSFNATLTATTAILGGKTYTIELTASETATNMAKLSLTTPA